ncbi:MAG: hypothetical protein U1E91_02055 [Moraxella sp.]
MDVAPHLQKLLNQLDWVGQDLDSLVDKTHTDIATLMGWLIELELMGLVMQRGGLYMRCRPPILISDKQKKLQNNRGI